MKILLASLPAAGHFNPLTGLAVHLRRQGHDARWYTGPTYAKKLASLGVPHFPFERATDVNGENLAERFPEYKKLGNGPRSIAFALEKIFFGNLEAHYRDICALHPGFPFEAIVFDGGFYAGRLVAEKLGVAAYPVCPAPSPAPSSAEAPPPFFGLQPAKTALGRLRDRAVRAMVERSTLGGMKVWNALRAREGLAPTSVSLFDLHVETSRAIFMVGAPGLDFPRSDWPRNLLFVGPLMPHKTTGGALPAHLEEKIAHYGRVVVVSQGTIDNRDPEKLFVPTLGALAGSPEHLVVATTGGLHSDELRRRFPQDNVAVEDWVDFDQLLPQADVFVCNGGFGSILLGLMNGTRLITAGKLEGKNDVNARLAYRGVALDLKTERPRPKQVASAIARVLADPRYEENVGRLKAELETYRPFELIERTLVSGHAPSEPAPRRA